MSADIAVNRKARRDYHILETIEAGIELKGTEVKSIRAGKVQLQGSYARVEKGQIYLLDSDIQPYEKASHEQHDPRRPRRLLLHHYEIDRLAGEIEKAGKTIVPLRLYWKKNRVKVELGIAKGKAASDRRADLKARAQERENQRMLASLQKRGKA